MSSQPKDVPLAVVLGGQANGLSFLRSLGRRTPTLMLAGHDPGSRFGFTLELPDAEAQPEMWLRVLDRMGAHLTQPGILLPTSDPLVLLVARSIERLGSHYSALVPRREVAESIVDKRTQYEHAIQVGIPIPETHFPDSVAELRALAPRLSYPRLLKPYRSHITKARLGAKALIVGGPEQLVDQYARYVNHTDQLMVQDVVPGGEDALFGYVALWDADGREHSAITRRKLRQYPPRIGNGSLQVSVEQPEVMELGRRLITSLDYRGPVAVEFKRDARDGLFRLIEINPRTGASNQLTIDAGVDMPWFIYQMASRSGTVPTPPPPYRRGVQWLYEELDFRAYRAARAAGEITLGQWLASIRRTRSWAYWAWDDPAPFTRRLTAYLRARARRDSLDAIV